MKTFNDSDLITWANRDAVKEEKKYRACMSIKDLYELVSDSKCKMSDEECIHQLISDFIIHVRSKVTGTEYYTSIITISVDVEVNNYVKIALSPKSYQSFNELFENYEIEINSEWQPFGVPDED